jgi:hypothetical protein
MNKIYTGIGARVTPMHINKIFISIGEILANKGYILRSGAADAAFEEGCDKVSGQKEIFLPWKGFNNHSSELYQPSPRAFDIAKEHHPMWNALTTISQKFMARNTEQVLGELLYEPTDLVICWTQDGCESDVTRSKATGGTGQAISVASLRDIPVFNLKNEGSLDRLVEFLDGIE